ncbi:DUF4328 domain-containing protein [Asticcacaulis sp.]|uniref:DUF4328 domain-containing protein n=1 Tax=Asticcacaulis sp. TaxID=1872648 RepID=UPI003F7C85B5
MAKETSDYRQPRVLTALLFTIIAFQIFSAALVGAVLALAVIRGENLEMPPEIFAVYNLVRRSLFVTPLTITVVKMFWIYRTSKNTHEITSKTMEFSPGWAVGWHFIPFAALWQPYLVYSELYRANRDPENWKTQKASPIILIWWIFTIVSEIVGMAINVAGKDGSEIPLVVSAAILSSLAIHQAMALFIYSRIASFQKKARTPSQVEQVF